MRVPTESYFCCNLYSISCKLFPSLFLEKLILHTIKIIMKLIFEQIRLTSNCMTCISNIKFTFSIQVHSLLNMKLYYNSRLKVCYVYFPLLALCFSSTYGINRNIMPHYMSGNFFYIYTYVPFVVKYTFVCSKV